MSSDYWVTITREMEVICKEHGGTWRCQFSGCQPTVINVIWTQDERTFNWSFDLLEKWITDGKYLAAEATIRDRIQWMLAEKLESAVA